MRKSWICWICGGFWRGALLRKLRHFVGGICAGALTGGGKSFILMGVGSALGRSYTAPKWWNGRRSGLKIRSPRGGAGSSPAFGTKLEPGRNSRVLIFLGWEFYLIGFPQCGLHVRRRIRSIISAHPHFGGLHLPHGVRPSAFASLKGIAVMPEDLEREGQPRRA